MSTYISLDNLARYDMKAKARAEGLYADASAACWQKTEKAGAVTCVPAPETPLEPVVEFLFKETLPSGTKGPGNPSVIEGVESIKATRCGKNLAKINPNFRTVTTNGITMTSNGDGTLVANGAASANTFFYISTEENRSFLKAGNSYILSGCPSGGGSATYRLAGHYRTGGVGRYFVDFGDGSVSTPTEDCLCQIYIYFISGTTVSNLVFKPQLELGSTATIFEPYAGTDYTIDLNGTFYGGTLDVTSGKLTVTHRMVEPSSGTVDISDRPALLPLECTDTYGRTVTSDGNTLSVGSSGGQIVYRLANPYTVYVDPVQIDSLPAIGKTSPRINTVYTDALNVQVGYAEHPAYTEELINNAILALGGDI